MLALHISQAQGQQFALQRKSVRQAADDHLQIFTGCPADEFLVKEIELHFEKGRKEGEMKIQAWGRRPTPLPDELRDFCSKTLRNQDGKYPRQDSNLRHSD